jgi:transposase
MLAEDKEVNPMRGKSDSQPPMFFAIRIEDRVRPDHPLRAIKRMVDEELSRMSRLFNAAYSDTGRPGVPPERLLKSMLLQALYSVRSETQLVERIDSDLLFRWFLDMDPAEAVFDQTAFTHNRWRLEQHGIIKAFFDGVVKRAMGAGLTSDEHFSVDGTLIESHASIKSFVPKDQLNEQFKDQDNTHNDSSSPPRDGNGFKSRNTEVDFHGQKRSNATHASRTDPQARLYKKGDGQPARLYHTGHAITENRHGIVMEIEVSESSGDAEPAAALTMLDALGHRLGVKVATLGSDKGYDSGPYLIELEKRGVEPHTAMKKGPVGGQGRREKKDLPLIEARQRMEQRTQGQRYPISQRCRKKIEEVFGWLKTIAGLYRTRMIGRWKLKQQMQLAAAAYNLLRIRKLAA